MNPVPVKSPPRQKFTLLSWPRRLSTVCFRTLFPHLAVASLPNSTLLQKPSRLWAALSLMAPCMATFQVPRLAGPFPTSFRLLCLSTFRAPLTFLIEVTSAMKFTPKLRRLLLLSRWKELLTHSAPDTRPSLLVPQSLTRPLTEQLSTRRSVDYANTLFGMNLQSLSGALSGTSATMVSLQWLVDCL